MTDADASMAHQLVELLVNGRPEVNEGQLLAFVLAGELKIYALDKKCFSEVSPPRTCHLCCWLMIIHKEMHRRANYTMSVPLEDRDSHEL